MLQVLKIILLKLQSLSRMPRTEKDQYFIFLNFALVLPKSPYGESVLSLGYHCDQFCLSVIIPTSFVSRLSLRPVLSLGYHCDQFCLSVIIATSFDFCESWGNSRIRFLSIEVKFRFTWGEWEVYQTWNWKNEIFH